MQFKKTYSNKRWSQLALIVLGIVIAVIMSLQSPFFSTEVVSSPDVIKTEPVTTTKQKAEEKLEKNGTSSSGLNSAARFFHIFTNSLPYLNNK